jgi:hypothetical protein
MAALQGLRGLTGLTPTVVPSVVMSPQDGPDEVFGGPANPVHGSYEWGSPVPWSISQGLDLSNQPDPGTGAGMLGGVPENAAAGIDEVAYADPTFTKSHGGPWPWQHIPDSGAVNNSVATARMAAANAELHAIDTGVPASFTNQPVPGHKMAWEISPDYSTQGAATGVDPGGLTGNNHTGWDRFDGWAVEGENINSHGFDQAHVTRQTPVADKRHLLPVPLDTMQGQQRPMVMNIPGRYGSYPVGQGSPFAGQLPGVGNDTGAAEIGVASDYIPPPDAPTNPPVQASSQGAPWGWSGLGY